MKKNFYLYFLLSVAVVSCTNERIGAFDTKSVSTTQAVSASGLPTDFVHDNVPDPPKDSPQPINSGVVTPVDEVITSFDK